MLALARKIEGANAEALRRMLAGDPVLVDVVPAGTAVAGLGERHILHAGPPIPWERMCGPLRGAIAGIAVFEGWARDLDDAEAKAAALAAGALGVSISGSGPTAFALAAGEESAAGAAAAMVAAYAGAGVTATARVTRPDREGARLL